MEADERVTTAISRRMAERWASRRRAWGSPARSTGLRQSDRKTEITSLISSALFGAGVN